MRMATTLDDVAKRSGYSPATISRVVNGTEKVRPEVKIAVEKAIRELGYVTRRSRYTAGGHLVEVVLHRSGSIEQISVDAGGVSVGRLAPVEEETLLTPAWQSGNEFHLRILNGILAELKLWGGKAVLQVVTELDPRLAQGLSDDISGLLLVGEGGPGIAALAAACAKPTVLVDMLDPAGGHEQVTTDNLAGIGAAVDHLAGLGHRAIGYVGGSDLPPARERSQAFAYHAARRGLVVPAGWSEVVYDHVGPTAERIATLLRQGGRPSGIVCANDWGALAVVRAADAAGLRVPRDLSVVGFDDLAMSALATPPITSVRVPCEDLGSLAVRLLLSRRGRRPPGGCTVRLHPQLVVRGSTAPPPA